MSVVSPPSAVDVSDDDLDPRDDEDEEINIQSQKQQSSLWLFVKHATICTILFMSILLVFSHHSALFPPCSCHFSSSSSIFHINSGIYERIAHSTKGKQGHLTRAQQIIQSEHEKMEKEEHASASSQAPPLSDKKAAKTDEAAAAATPVKVGERTVKDQAGCGIPPLRAYVGQALGRPMFFDNATACCERCMWSPWCQLFEWDSFTKMCIILKDIETEEEFEKKRGKPDKIRVLTGKTHKVQGIKGRDNSTWVDFIPSSTVTHDWVKYKAPKWASISPSDLAPHPRLNNPSGPFCHKFEGAEVPEHGHPIEVCGSMDQVPIGIACTIECDEGYSLINMYPLCQNNVAWASFRGPLSKCIPREKEGHWVALQLEMDYVPGEQAPVKLLFPPHLYRGGNCTEAKCLLSGQHSFYLSQPRAPRFGRALRDYQRGLNPNYHTLDDDGKSLSEEEMLKLEEEYLKERLSGGDKSPMFKEFQDPTNTYSIWPPAAVVLNMIHRTDRLSETLDFLTLIDYPFDRFYRSNGVHIYQGEIGNLASHWVGVEFATKMGFKWFMMLEADVMLDEHNTRDELVSKFNELGPMLMENTKYGTENNANGVHFDALQIGGDDNKWNGQMFEYGSLKWSHMWRSYWSQSYIISTWFARTWADTLWNGVQSFRYEPHHTHELWVTDHIWDQFLTQGNSGWWAPFPDRWITQNKTSKSIINQ